MSAVAASHLQALSTWMAACCAAARCSTWTRKTGAMSSLAAQVCGWVLGVVLCLRTGGAAVHCWSRHRCVLCATCPAQLPVLCVALLPESMLAAATAWLALPSCQNVPAQCCSARGSAALAAVTARTACAYRVLADLFAHLAAGGGDSVLALRLEQEAAPAGSVGEDCCWAYYAKRGSMACAATHFVGGSAW